MLLLFPFPTCVKRCCCSGFYRGFFVVAVVACLFDLSVCRFVGLFVMTCALLKFELTVRVVLGTIFFKEIGRFCFAFHFNLSFVIL